jgi:beta-lactamase superfamily II metal-dependent hydrolase
MQLTVFQSDQGDCLLLTDSGGTTRILVDGGMPAAYSQHVAPALGELRKKNKNLDLVYVSHVDRDHIGGVLRMLDDEVLWRVHDHQIGPGKNPAHKPPKAPRPPKILNLWHNGFNDVLEDDADPIEQVLSAMAPVLSGAELESLRNAGLAQAGLVSSVRDAFEVSRRISPQQLKIPLNKQAGGKLFMLKKGAKPIKLGPLVITVVAPTAKHLEKLRQEWKKFLELASSQQFLRDLEKTSREDEKAMGAAGFDQLFAMVRLQAEAIGKPESVTPPNMASLMLLVEEGSQSILLTGDGRWDQLVEGLEKAGRLAPGGQLAVNVLKVPHHGAEHNVVDTDLLDRVVGKHYVFCGNGHSGNPEPEVVEIMAQKRLKAAGGKFKFWFNCSSSVAGPDEKDHMIALETKVKAVAKGSKGRMTFKFLETGSSLRVI